MRAATEYAVLSEELGRDLCSVMANLLRSHTEQSPSLHSAPLLVTLEALRAGRKLLESFPGMQEGILGPVGSLACCAGVDYALCQSSMHGSTHVHGQPSDALLILCRAHRQSPA